MVFKNVQSGKHTCLADSKARDKMRIKTNQS